MFRHPDVTARSSSSSSSSSGDSRRYIHKPASALLLRGCAAAGVWVRVFAKKLRK